MSSTVFYAPRARFFDANGNPLSFGRVSFFFPNTTTLKAVYTDGDATIPATNPHLLDVEGYVRDGGLYLGAGDYKVVLEESDGGGGFNVLWTMDPVFGGAQNPSGIIDTAVIDNIASLRALDIDLFDAVYVMGYYAIGDGGGGWFNFEATSSVTDDLGSVISPNGSPAQGRWIRNFLGTDANAIQWGAVTGTTDPVDGRILSMIDYVVADNKSSTAIFPDEYYAISGSFTMTGDCDLVFEDGARFVEFGANTGQALVISTTNATIKGNAEFISTTMSLEWNPVKKNIVPVSAWGYPSDSMEMFNNVNNNGSKVLVDKTYTLTAVGTSNYTTEDLYFTESGKIDNQLAVGASLTINRMTADTDITDLFTGNLAQFSWANEKTFRAEWFLTTTITAAVYQDLLECITNADTTRAELIWGYYSNYTFSQAFSLPSDKKYQVLNTVSADTKVQFDGNVYFGTVSNGPEPSIFSKSSTNSPILNQVIYPHWWGLTSGEDGSSSNTTSLNFAFLSATASQGSIVDLNGMTVVIDAEVQAPSSSDFGITLNNGGIVADSSFTDDFLLDVDPSFEFNGISLINAVSGGVLQNLTSTGRGLFFNDCSILTFGDCVACENVTAGLLEFTNTTLNNVNQANMVNVISGTRTVVGTGSKFIGDGFIVLGSVEFSGCRFVDLSETFPSGGIVTGCDFSGTGGPIFSDGSTITGCSFNGMSVVGLNGETAPSQFNSNRLTNVPLRLSNPSFMVVSNNTFYTSSGSAVSNIIMIGGVVDYTSQSMMISDNTFKNDTAPNADVVSEGSNMKTFGHIDCVVKGNTVFGDLNYKGTEHNQTVIVNSSASLDSIGLGSSWIVLSRLDGELVGASATPLLPAGSSFEPPSFIPFQFSGGVGVGILILFEYATVGNVKMGVKLYANAPNLEIIT